MIVFLVHIRGSDHEISGGFRIGDGNIVYLRNTKERLYVRVVRRCGQRVRKEDHQVDPAPVSYTHLDVYKRQVDICTLYSSMQ